jgi:Protein of unknown function (DUF3631)
MTSALPSNYVPDKVLAFIDQLVYCRDEYKDVLTAMLAVSRVREAFTTVPHLLATAESPASGKTTLACDIPRLLAYNPWKIGKLTTRDALKNKYLERIRPNPVADDIGKIFGDSGMNGRDNPVYALLIDCYRDDGTVSVSRNGTTLDLPSYGMAFMNGLKNAVPADLFTRAIWFQMEEAPSGLNLRDALDESVRADAQILREALHSWAAGRQEQMTAFMRGPVRFVHPKLEKRRRQKWGPLFAFAACAGGTWPQRIFDAFVAIELGTGEKPVPVPEQRVLLDLSSVIMRRELSSVFVSDAVNLLRALPDGDYYRKAEDSHLIGRVLPDALGPSKVITSVMLTGEHAGVKGRAKGWQAAPVLKAAIDLREMLYPPMVPVPDTVDEELAFEPSVK